MAATIETLKAELSSASHWQQDLEHRVQGLTREKQLAEEKAGSLADEIEQARVALADEWVDHMNDHDQLTVAAHEKQLAEEKAGSLAAEIGTGKGRTCRRVGRSHEERPGTTYGSGSLLKKQQLEKSLSRAEEPEA